MISSLAVTAVTQAIFLFSGNLEQQGKQVNTTHVIETCREANTPTKSLCGRWGVKQQGVQSRWENQQFEMMFDGTKSANYDGC